MPSVRIIDPLQDSSWDASLAQHPRANAFHTSAWCRVLHETYGYKPLYLMSGSTAVLPLMEVDSWLTGKRGVSLPFTDACDPLTDDAATLQAVHESVRAEGAQRRWKYVEYRTDKIAASASLRSSAASASTRFFGHTLPLSTNEPVQFERCDPSVRRAIRKAEQAQVTIEFSSESGAMDEFVELLAQTRRRHGVPVQPSAFFTAIQRHLLEAGLGWVVLARQRGAAVAGAVFFHFGRRVIFKFGASDERFQHLRANNLVMWSAIRRYAAEGFESLDFGRTSADNEGLRRFKLGWGANEQEIAYFRWDLRSGEPISAPDRSEGWHTPVFRRIPVFLSRLIGALLYRHIA